MEYNKETKTLKIHYEFNEELKNIPEDTKTIFFQYEHYISLFNQKVDNLPQNLTCIIFGLEFNKKVNYLPKNLTYLSFGWVIQLFRSKFNQKINCLPKNLTHLTFVSKFNQKIDKLPKNLIHLTFGGYFTKKVNLENYFLNSPKNIKKLTLNSNNNLINNIPEHIEKIYIFFDFLQVKFPKIENLPSTIKKIIIEKEKYKKYIKIPFGCILKIKNLTHGKL
jgi:hypothetical protein